jgi:hypothetical protein
LFEPIHSSADSSLLFFDRQRRISRNPFWLRLGRVIRLTLTMLIFASASFSFGQTYSSQVTGIVKDTGGAIVPNALLEATDIARGTTTIAKSDESGVYRFPSLLPSTYRIFCTAAGFRSFEQAVLPLQVDQVFQLDIILQVGEVKQTIVVSTIQTGVETANASLGQVITQKEIEDLPLNLRDSLGLIALTPGTVLGPNFSDGGGGNIGRNFFRSDFNVGGGRSGSQAIMLDGAPNTTGDVSRAVISPPVDAVQEFKVQATSYDAQFGRTSGGVVNVLTKSGTNDIHGSVYDFERDSSMDASNYFASGTVPDYHRRQVGGVVGFPILRDRWFMFGDFEALRQQLPVTTLSSVPTQAQRSGDFSSTYYQASATNTPAFVTIYDPVTYSSATGKRTAFKGNIIPLGRLNAVALNILKSYPLPNQAGNAVTNVNNYVYTDNSVTNTNKYDLRTDLHVGGRTTLFGRFSRQTDARIVPGAMPPAIGGTVTDDHYTQVVIGLSRVITPNLFANIETSFTRGLANQAGGLPTVDLASLGFSSTFAAESAPQLPIISMADYRTLTLKSSVGQQHQPRNNYVTTGLITFTHGRHALKAGAEYWILNFNEYQNAASSGTLKFDHTFTQQNPASATSKTQGNDLASFLLGIPSGVSSTTGAAGSFIRKVQGISTGGLYSALFVQDDFRASGRLTLNLGLRWDLSQGNREKYNRIAYFDPTAPSSLAQPANLPNLTGAAVWAGQGNSRNQQETKWTNFNPRFGFAYQLPHQAVLRGGYGIFFLPKSVAASGAGAIGTTVDTLMPIDSVIPTNSLTDPFPQGVTLPSNTRDPNTGAGSTISIPLYKYSSGYVQMFSLDVQKQLPWGLVFDTHYWGNLGTHVATSKNLNQLPNQYLSLGSKLTTTTVANPFYGVLANQSAPGQKTITLRQSLLPYPQYVGDSGVAQVYEPSGKTNYNAGTVQVTKRFSSALSLNAAYTYAKSMDNLGVPLDSYNRAGEYALSDMDVTHQAIISVLGQLPFGRGRRFAHSMNRVMEKTLGGWDANTIIRIQSGFPVNISRPAVLAPGSNPHLDHPTPQQWFNTSVITSAGSYSFGNMGRQIPHVRSDMLQNIDFVLVKNIAASWREHPITTQLRAESYNFLNHPQLSAPNGTPTSSNFGTITTQANRPRAFQFAVKVKF